MIAIVNHFIWYKQNRTWAQHINAYFSFWLSVWWGPKGLGNGRITSLTVINSAYLTANVDEQQEEELS